MQDHKFFHRPVDRKLLGCLGSINTAFDFEIFEAEVTLLKKLHKTIIC